MLKKLVPLAATLLLFSCNHNRAGSADSPTSESKDEPAKNSEPKNMYEERPVTKAPASGLTTNFAGSNTGTYTVSVNDAGGAASSTPNADDVNETPAPSAPVTKPVPAQKTPSKIIRTANIQFRVNDIKASHAKLAAMLTPYNAYFGTDNETTQSNRIDDNITIRVPAANFDKLMDGLMGESVYTDSKDISAEDVTADYVDIAARLKTKKEVAERYTALLKQANKIPDILEVENNLRTMQEEIEATEGRLKVMDDQVAYSTIVLNMYQTLQFAPQPETGFLSNLWQAVVNGWRGVLSFIVGFAGIWPLDIVILLLALIVYRKVIKTKHLLP